MRFVCPALLTALFLALYSVASAQSPSVTMPAKMTVAPDATANLALALDTPAPPGGVTITLSSSNPSIASVWPPSMVIPMEMTTPPRLIPTITGHLAGTVTISAAAPGYTTATMQVQAGSGSGNGNPGPGAISLTPANLTVPIATTQILTVVLSAPAPAGGVTVNVSSNNSSVSFVSGVNIAAGLSSATLTVSGVAVGSATITASAANFGAGTASVVVSGDGGGRAPQGIIVPSSLTLVPGDIREYSVQLASAAPANGVYVTTVSSDTSRVSLSQSSIFIPEGMTSVPRNVTTVSARSSGAATINVSAAGYASTSTQVQVSGSTPSPGAGTMSFSPATLSITGGETKTLTLSLSSPAGSGGLAVNLNSSNTPAASVPSVVNIPAGTAAYNVPVTGAAAGAASITASASNYGSAAANVTVSASAPPPTPPPSGGTIVVPATLAMYPGDSVTFPVSLALPSGASGVQVTLTSSDPGKAIVSPSSFVITDGTTSSRRVEILVTAVSVGSATITASAPGFTSGNSQVQVKSAAPGGIMTISPAGSAMITGNTQNLTLTLTGALPPNGLVVYLTSSNTSAVTVAGSVTVPAHGTSIAIPVAAVGTGASTITATASNFGSAAAGITVSATPQILLPSTVTLAAGETVNLPVTLSAAASADTVVALTSGDVSKVTVAPASFTILKGMTSAPNVTATVSGVAAGAASVTATSPGYTTASKQVVVTAPPTSPGITMGLSPSNLSITGLITQNLTLTLSSPAPAGGLAVTFKSSDGSVASVSSSLTVPANTTSISVPVTALAAGSTMITASATGIPSATATVNVAASVVGTLSIPASWGVSPNQSNNLQVTLNPAAPAGGVTLTFTSSATSKATVNPGTVTVPSGGTFATVQVTGVASGAANISVSAPGYTGASTQVQIAAATGSGVFIPGLIAVNAGITETVSLSLGPLSPAGLTVSLVSSDPAVAKVPATVVVPANAYNVSVPVAALAAGSATITATTPNFGTSKLTVNVLSLTGVSVEWHGICWVPRTLGGVTYMLHALDFKLTAPKPVILQGSLFFTADCTGTLDNMNDFDSTTSSTHMIQGFSNYPDIVPSSAIFWIGARTADGKCPPGSPCSGCLTYTKQTPTCDALP